VRGHSSLTLRQGVLVSAHDGDGIERVAMALPALVLVHGGAHASDCWDLTSAKSDGWHQS